jgi:hypothetical protein
MPEHKQAEGGEEEATSRLQAALRMTPAERLREGQRLSDEARKQRPRSFKPFWKSFDSFEELERWRAEHPELELD